METLARDGFNLVRLEYSFEGNELAIGVAKRTSWHHVCEWFETEPRIVTALTPHGARREPPAAKATGGFSLPRAASFPSRAPYQTLPRLSFWSG